MVSELNKLAELVQLDSLPAWLQKEVELRKDEIIAKLQTEGSFVIKGPNGELVTIRPKAKEAAA